MTPSFLCPALEITFLHFWNSIFYMYLHNEMYIDIKILD